MFDFGSGKANLCVKTEDCNNGTELVQVSSGNWIFKGLYSNKIWNEEHSELGLAYAYAGTDNPGGAKQGTFGKIASGASAKPFQAYLLKKNSDVKLDPAVCCASMNCSNGHPAALSKSAFEMSGIPETIDVEFIDEDENGEYTTSVGRMNTRTGEFEMLHDYDLKGRKLNGASQARGAYYGKKVLKK